MNELVLFKPNDKNIDDFILYFQRTWLSSIYPKDLWNHYSSEGPRTNNHVEGDNAALNRFVNVDSPKIYDLILCMKYIESTFAVKYFKNKETNEPQKRRQEDINRDKAIQECRLQLARNQVSINGYLQKISLCFYFTDAKKIPSSFNIASILDNSPSGKI